MIVGSILLAGMACAAPVPGMQEPGAGQVQETPLAPLLLSIRQASVRKWQDWLLEVREDGLVRYGGINLGGGIICTQGEESNDWTRPPALGRVTWQLDAERLVSVVAQGRELAEVPFKDDPDLKPDQERDLRIWTIVTPSGSRTIVHTAGDQELPAEVVRLEGSLERATLLWRRQHRSRIEWLTKHQEDDGSWKAGGLPASCNPFHGATCTGNGDASFDGTVTALAVLCLTGCGYDEVLVSPYQEVLRDARRWLEADIARGSAPGSPASPHGTLEAACRALAAVEIAALNPLPERKRFAAERLTRLAALQRHDGTFAGPADDPADAPASTGFAAFAFWNARDADIAAALPAREVIWNRLRRAQAAGAEGTLDRAVAAAIALRCGEDSAEAGLAAVLDLLEADLTEPAETLRKPGAEFLFFATAAMAMAGGERWDRWSKAIKPFVVADQQKDECAAGSWDPTTVRDLHGGRAWTTALMTLTLEIYYRFPMVLSAPAGSRANPK